MLSHHNGIKIEIKNRKIFRKFPNIWNFKNILLNNTKSNEKL